MTRAGADKLGRRLHYTGGPRPVQVSATGRNRLGQEQTTQPAPSDSLSNSPSDSLSVSLDFLPTSLRIHLLFTIMPPNHAGPG